MDNNIANKLIQIAQKQQELYEIGFDAGQDIGYTDGVLNGKKELLESFWEDMAITINQNGVVADRTNYQYAFNNFTPEIFYPTKNLKMTYANYSFDTFNKKGEYFDLKSRLEECGVKIDLSGCRDVSGMFLNSKIDIIPTLDLTGSNITTFNRVFNNAKVETIEKLIFKSDGSQTIDNNAFNTTTLKNITFEGVIGVTVTFANCTLLTKASIESIISVLSTTASGKSLTLSLTAVNNAFETSVGANDGSNSSEWQTLVNTRQNWTINLS